jgi:hypothetical protein
MGEYMNSITAHFGDIPQWTDVDRQPMNNIGHSRSRSFAINAPVENVEYFAHEAQDQPENFRPSSARSSVCLPANQMLQVEEEQREVKSDSEGSYEEFSHEVRTCLSF